MKAVFIIYNHSITEEVQDILDHLGLRGYTQWTDIRGRGTATGLMHEGTHTWPELNNAHLVMADDAKVPPLLERLHALDKAVEDQGLRAFVWNIEGGV